MQKCRYCGADLLETTSFCGSCGRVQDALASEEAATRSNMTQPSSRLPEDGTIPASRPLQGYDPVQGSAPTWSASGQALVMPSLVAENEDDQKGAIASTLLFDGTALGGEALLGSNLASPSSVPSVQGTPQVGSVPSVTGSPNLSTHISPGHPVLGAGHAAPVSPSVEGITRAPVSHPMQGPTNTPVSHPIQGPTNTPVSHPVQGPTSTPVSHPVQGPTKPPVNHPTQGPTKPPVNHPTQGPAKPPVSHPVHGPEPHPQPPDLPGTHKHHPPQEPHRPHPRPKQPEPKRDHDHDTQHKSQRDHDHDAQHEHHQVTKMRNVTGGSTVKTILLVVTAVVVVAAGGIGAALHFLAHPQPLISISSNYKVGNTPAGANGTSLHISGQNFASNSPITFLLDGHVAPGNAGTRSDSNGNFSTNVAITSAWSVGTHTLTAKDGSNGSPKNNISVTIVQPGQSNTPGPNGAPPDDASFRVKVTIANGLADPFSQNPVLIITGHPDPEGGTVCSPDDSGQSFTYNELAADGTTLFTKTITASCSGTYKAGQINFIETSTSIKQYWQYSGVNVTCVLNNPTVDLRLTGIYAGNNTFKGTLSSPYFTYTCDQGYNNTYHEATQGVTWIGTIVTQ